jgi:hypothetical protein
MVVTAQGGQAAFAGPAALAGGLGVVEVAAGGGLAAAGGGAGGGAGGDEVAEGAAGLVAGFLVTVVAAAAALMVVAGGGGQPGRQVQGQLGVAAGGLAGQGQRRRDGLVKLSV